MDTVTPGEVITVSATQFKAKCLSIFDELEARKLSRVIVTRRGKPVAELTPAAGEAVDVWGAHRGSARYAEGVDPTAPVFDEDWEPEQGMFKRK